MATPACTCCIPTDVEDAGVFQDFVGNVFGSEDGIGAHVVDEATILAANVDLADAASWAGARQLQEHARRHRRQDKVDASLSHRKSPWES